MMYVRVLLCRCATLRVQELQRAFARAAALVKEKQQEDAMSDAEKVVKYVKRWAKEWEAEVEGMPPEVLATGAGAA